MLMTAVAETRPGHGVPMGPSTAEKVSDELLVLETRFGRIEIDRNRIVDIPDGLLGFADRNAFALTPIPDRRLERFLLLQSVEDPALSFIVVPLAQDSGLVDADDIEEICAAARTNPADALLALIVTVRKGAAGIEMTANLRAPVVIDTRRMSARQCVFSNNRYPIRHAL